MPDDELRALLGRARDELFHAKSLVRHTRNHTKLQAAALQDSEGRIDDLIDDLETCTTRTTGVPTPKEAQEHDHSNKQAHVEDGTRIRSA